MKKYFLVTLIIFTLFTSCIKDDFCIDPITPNLVISFYDNDNPDNLKTTTDLTVWAEGLEELYTEVDVDSILVPLDPGNDITVYHLKLADVEDEITITYTRNEVFVSRSCGFKYNFENLEIPNNTNNWIIDTQITNQTVEDETEHIKILY